MSIKMAKVKKTMHAMFLTAADRRSVVVVVLIVMRWNDEKTDPISEQNLMGFPAWWSVVLLLSWWKNAFRFF